MTACPICSTEATAKRTDTPYWTCPGCGVWFQSPAPPKRWHGEHETWVGKPMPDDEKCANEQLAAYLFETVMQGRPGAVLDIGASYPYLLDRILQNDGCVATALDGAPSPNDLGIDVLQFDLDSATTDIPYAPYNLVVTVHTAEHVYDPIKMFRKIRRALVDTGAWFIRMPDNQVSGIERDLFDTMYEIHPFVHSLSSIAQLCAQTDTFMIESTYEVRPGQRDMVLRPIV